MAGIDINMGCPLPFSVQGGMGSALLSKPDVVSSIIRTLKASLKVPVTAKIRLLKTPEETVALARVIEAAGADALTVHCRYVSERPRMPSHWDLLPEVIRSVKIPVLVNGSVFERDDVARARQETGAAGVMVARGALYNSSIFRPLDQPLISNREHIREYVRLCMRYDNKWGFTKYTVQLMLDAPGSGASANREDKVKMAQTHDWQGLCALFGVTDYEDLKQYATPVKTKEEIKALKKKGKRKHGEIDDGGAEDDDDGEDGEAAEGGNGNGNGNTSGVAETKNTETTIVAAKDGASPPESEAVARDKEQNQ